MKMFSFLSRWSRFLLLKDWTFRILAHAIAYWCDLARAKFPRLKRMRFRTFPRPFNPLIVRYPLICLSKASTVHCIRRWLERSWTSIKFAYSLRYVIHPRLSANLVRFPGNNIDTAMFSWVLPNRAASSTLLRVFFVRITRGEKTNPVL